MEAVLITPPGKFPTLQSDPNVLWSAITQLDGVNASLLNLNYHWWRMLCSPLAIEALLAPYSFTQKTRKRLEWTAQGIDLNGLSTGASKALAAFQQEETFRRAEGYFEAAGNFSRYLSAFNEAQAEIDIALFHGPRVNGLDYADSRSLVDYARQDSLLSRLIGHTLEQCSITPDVILFSVTFPEDLLTALITAQHFRTRPGKTPYLCLADHGYENFTLQPHMERLQASGQLTRIFDSVIVAKDERHAVLSRMLPALQAGERPVGFLRAEAETQTVFLPPPPSPVFSPVPVLWTRLSERRCYWSRCTFCVQNAKYDNPQPVSLSELSLSLDKLASYTASGYRHFIFSDEALSPSFLKNFARGVIERGISCQWSCRCRIESGFTPEIFQAMKQAGCYEILFGLESSSTRMLRLMDKHENGLDLPAVRRMFREIADQGIGLHITMISGFPGDTPEESEETVRFVIDALKDLPNATFKLNLFELFPETPVLKDPQAFGIQVVEPTGDMPSGFHYSYTSPEQMETAIAVYQALPELTERLYGELGWTNLKKRHADDELDNPALYLYFHTGHGTVFKTDPSNVFRNPLIPENSVR